MIIMAFDASINNTGYAVIDTDKPTKPESRICSGTIKYSTDNTTEGKSVLLGHNVAELCQLHKPDVVLVEKAEAITYARSMKYTGKTLNAGSMALNSYSAGIIAGVATQYCVNLVLVSAQTWKGLQKKAVTRLIVNNEYKINLKRVNGDEADAIAIASWYVRELRMQKLAGKDGKTREH